MKLSMLGSSWKDLMKKSVFKIPKSRAFLCGFGDVDVRSPLKFLNQMK